MDEARQAALWSRVEAHLDARTDPFADRELARELAAAPAVAASAERLRARLDGLVAHDVGARRRARRAQRSFALAACAAAVIVVAASLRPWRASVGVEHGIAQLSPPSALGVVYSARVEVEHTVPPPPRAALVVHAPKRIVAWSIAGETR